MSTRHPLRHSLRGAACALGLVLASACSRLGGAMDSGPPDDGVCTPPSAPTYDCAPLAPGSVGCSGTPPQYDFYTSVPDPAAVFAVGRKVDLPLCNPVFPFQVAQCTCFSADYWACPM